MLVDLVGGQLLHCFPKNCKIRPKIRFQTTPTVFRTITWITEERIYELGRAPKYQWRWKCCQVPVIKFIKSEIVWIPCVDFGYTKEFLGKENELSWMLIWRLWFSGYWTGMTWMSCSCSLLNVISQIKYNKRHLNKVNDNIHTGHGVTSLNSFSWPQLKDSILKKKVSSKKNRRCKFLNLLEFNLNRDYRIAIGPLFSIQEMEIN